MTIQPAFYPEVAEKMGAKPSEVSRWIKRACHNIRLSLCLQQYGFVYGISNLVAFFVAPMTGSMSDKFSVKTLLLVGGSLQGLAGFSLGFLDYVQDTKVFLGLSYMLR